MNKAICRHAKELDYVFVSECISNDIGINDICLYDFDFKNATLDKLITYIVDTYKYECFIVNRNGMDIGLVISYADESGFLCGKIFPHKHACKMSSISLIKVLSVYNCLSSILNTGLYGLYYLTMPYDHPVLIQAFSFVKDLLQLEYDPSTYVISGKNTFTCIDSLMIAVAYKVLENGFECTV